MQNFRAKHDLQVNKWRLCAGDGPVHLHSCSSAPLQKYCGARGAQGAERGRSKAADPVDKRMFHPMPYGIMLSNKSWGSWLHVCHSSGTELGISAEWLCYASLVLSILLFFSLPFSFVSNYLSPQVLLLSPNSQWAQSEQAAAWCLAASQVKPQQVLSFITRRRCWQQRTVSHSFAIVKVSQSKLFM